MSLGLAFSSDTGIPESESLDLFDFESGETVFSSPEINVELSLSQTLKESCSLEKTELFKKVSTGELPLEKKRFYCGFFSSFTIT